MAHENNGREKLLEMMRNYHSKSFPETFASKELSDLRENFERIEDQIVNMILRFIYGKAAFVDSSSDLTYFVDQSNKLAPGDLKDLYVLKISQMNELLQLAKDQDFKMRRTAAV